MSLRVRHPPTHLLRMNDRTEVLHAVHAQIRDGESAHLDQQ